MLFLQSTTKSISTLCSQKKEMEHFVSLLIQYVLLIFNNNTMNQKRSSHFSQFLLFLNIHVSTSLSLFVKKMYFRPLNGAAIFAQDLIRIYSQLVLLRHVRTDD